jgi:hypothetical protein
MLPVLVVLLFPLVILLIGVTIALIVRIIVEIAHWLQGQARRAGRCLAFEFFNPLQRFAFERGGGARNCDLPGAREPNFVPANIPAVDARARRRRSRFGDLRRGRRR